MDPREPFAGPIGFYRGHSVQGIMRATNLSVFKAGDIYALTVDETGSNLPKSSSSEWLRFGNTTTIDLAQVLPHALDDISERGFCLLEHSPTKPPAVH